jgi:CubicO group peptidase (beta-lactamase class C family)
LPSSLVARAATGYRTTGEAVEGRHHLYPEQAAAGLWTTPSDLARFMLEVGRAYRGETSVLLDSASARAMLREVMGGWGLGFAVSGSGDSLRFSHTGATEGYRAIAIGWASRGQGVVIMTNSDAGDQLYTELARAVAREYGWAWPWPER